MTPSSLQGTYSPVSPLREANGQCKAGEVGGQGPCQEEQEDDEESMDWWTKYFASIDTMIEVRGKVVVQMKVIFRSNL